MFSIVIPLYNKEKYIAQTLQSVLEQTYENFEIIIVDDGSTDESISEVEKFDDNRIQIIRQQNAGVSVARNRGIKEAKYNLIAFLDADDIWENNFLEAIINLQVKYPTCSVFAVNYTILSSDGKIKIPIINGLPENFQDGILKDYFKIASKSDPIICSISLAVTKAAIESLDGFPVGIRAGEDLLTWAKLASHYDIAYTIETKAIFNRIDQELSTPPRTPDTHDKVSEELRKLLMLEDQSRLNGLKDYIAYWHKIRIAIFLRLGKLQDAKQEFHKMAEFSKKDLKFFIYLILVYSPQWISKLLNISILQLNSYRRKIISNRVANK